MRNTLLMIAALALSVLCWGSYGAVLHVGQHDMSLADGALARYRPFVCVGLAYFFIGVLAPGLWLYFRGEQGDWTVRGTLWSLAAGALGATGALGIVLAFGFGGQPIYVMPLIFGGAPVVNAFLTIWRAGRVREIGSVFVAGLIMVILGAVVVLVFAPTAKAAQVEGGWFNLNLIWQLLAVGLTVCCWGSYGPTLHKGQVAMHHSRMRPLLCVGLSYFLIAVIVPNLLLTATTEASAYTFSGTLWSMAAGAAGAVGALGIIMSFNFGGSPIFVMPLVFGGAPVVNTIITTIAERRWGDVSPLFLAGLILVIAGSAIVLVLAPRGKPPAEPRQRKSDRPRPEPTPPAEAAGGTTDD